jgi:photosystem II stability/assembly factor-like uncharacterized protein
VRHEPLDPRGWTVGLLTLVLLVGFPLGACSLHGSGRHATPARGDRPEGRLPPQEDETAADIEERRNEPEVFINDEPPILGVQPRPTAGSAVGGTWIAQGPAPILEAHTGTVDREDVGAVHTVVAHPTNPDVLWIGAVSGGIWRTDDATAASPAWTPLTDDTPSLSIGALELDPTDPTHQTLVAGIGLFSSFGPGSAGGPLTGLLRTTDGGASWTPITHPLLLESISGVAPRGSTIVASASAAVGTLGGLFRSTDTGATWTKISGAPASMLPAGAVLDLVGDPGVPSRLYASVKSLGIYRSGNTGATWRKISDSDPLLNSKFGPFQDNNNAEMAVAANGRLYVSVVNGGNPVYVGYTDNPTAVAPTWAAMDQPLTPSQLTRPVADASNTAPIVITTISGTLTDATNTAPIVVTSAGHGLQSDELVRVQNVAGNTAANGFHHATVLDADHFELDGSAGNGAYTGGGDWYVVHEMWGGQTVEVAGVTGNTAANGIFTVTFVDNDKFSLDGTLGNGAYTGGGTWTLFHGLNPEPGPGSQGYLHFSIRADPDDPDTIYVGGDRQPDPFPNLLGATDYHGRLFRGDASIAPSGSFPSPQWDHLTHADDVPEFPGGGTAGSTAPHADSREIVLDAAGELIEVDDGGIYRRTSPLDNTGDWFSLMGDLQTTEFHDIAYDSNAGVILGGTQDNGSAEQIASGGTAWRQIGRADGGDVAIDDTSLAALSVRYSSEQYLNGLRRATYDAQNQLVSEAFPAREVVGGGTFVGQFVTPLELNAVDPTRLVVGGWNHVFESYDQAETLVAADDAGIRAEWDALAYGGRIGAVENPDVLYVGEDSTVWVRTDPQPAQPVPSAYPGGSVRGIVLDPDDWRVAYVVDPTRVWRTTDAGASWVELTGNLLDASLRAVDFGPGEVDSVFVGGLQGVWRMRTDEPGVWEPFGEALPHAPVYDLEYDAADDLLVAGTLGRGAWILPGATCAGGTDDADGDGRCDAADLCPFDPTNDDADGDGFCVDTDCAPLNDALWSVPGEARDLVLAHSGGAGGTTSLSWTAPAQVGGAVAVAYDTIASDDPDDFAGAAASCVESDDAADTSATDSVAPAPGALRAFLVRAENPCGSGTAGTASDGVPRAARDCP